MLSNQMIKLTTKKERKKETMIFLRNTIDLVIK